MKKWIQALLNSDRFETLKEFIQEHILSSPLVKKILMNTSWLFGGNLLGRFVGFIFSVFVIRYLGPEKYGKLTYVISMVGLGNFITKLGLPGISIREVVKEEGDRNEILGTTLILRVLGSLVLL